MLEHALQYAGRGWPIFRVTGYKTPLKGSHGYLDATSDLATVTQWWTEKPRSNIALATGDIVVIDLDGPGALAQFKSLVVPFGGLPKTLTAQTARGYHLFFKAPPGVRIGTFSAPRAAAGADGIDIKGHGGYCLLSPSRNAKNGFIYKWILDIPIVEMPQWLVNILQELGNKRAKPSENVLTFNKPTWLAARENQSGQGLAGSLSNRLSAALRPQWTLDEENRIGSALAAIPPDIERDPWLHIGMALHGLGWVKPDGTDAGLEIWDRWSSGSKTKYQGLGDLETRWRSFGKPGREQVTLGTLFHIAAQHGWQSAPAIVEPPVKEVMSNDVRSETRRTETTPHPDQTPPGGALFFNGHATAEMVVAPGDEKSLIDLNNKYSVIGDVGGKCLVLGWVSSKVDETVRVPSFQTFKSFTERYSNKYVMTHKPKDGKWVEDMQQMGAAWLKWSKRVSYEGIDLVPSDDEVLPGKILNLWQGFAVAPRAGSWQLMRQHIAKVLARSDIEALEYIIKWSAWKVQHPGERAEVALVFKGPKGSGKGTFANALKRMFGQHGLQIFNSKHLVGSFNGHLRNCLLLFADEAYWAGDKQGESVLKGLVTEPSLMIEQKGVDACAWKNRLGVIMAANNEWVVPASHDERRYAVFDVSAARTKDQAYFKALYHEMMNGGLEAMLYDLQRVDLKDWHPRKVPQTEALQQQKLRSLDPRYEWFENLLSEGVLIGCIRDQAAVPASFIMNQAKEVVPRLRDVSQTALGRFLGEMGCIKMHTDKGSAWRFGELKEHRARWVERFGKWAWSQDRENWLLRF